MNKSRRTATNLVLSMAAAALISCDMPAQESGSGHNEVTKGTGEVRVNAGYQNFDRPVIAGATWIGLVPKVPGWASGNVECPFKTAVFMDDENSTNDNDFYSTTTDPGGAPPGAKKNVAVGGFVRLPQDDGRPGRNSMVMYCQLPVKQMPRTRQGYGVIAAQAKSAGSGRPSSHLLENRPECPAGGIPYTRKIDTEGSNGASKVVGDPDVGFPTRTYHQTSFHIADSEDRASKSEHDVVINFCWFPGTNDPNDPELPTSLEIYNLATNQFETHPVGEHFLYHTRGTVQYAEFTQDNDDATTTDVWVNWSGAKGHVVGTTAGFDMHSMVESRDGLSIWYVGWTGSPPGTGGVEYVVPGDPIPCDPWGIEPSHLKCAAHHAAKLVKACLDSETCKQIVKAGAGAVL